MLVVIAHGEGPERLLAALGGALAARATVRAEPMAWGALVLADAPHARSDRWLVAGRPQQDPWGLPLGDLPLDQAVAEYERYGTQAAHLGSGPFIAVDLATGRLLRAPSGIVPVFEGVGPNGLVAGTSRRALALLAHDVREIPAGETAGPPGAGSVATSSSPERIRSLRWEWLDEEITKRVTQLGPLAPVRLSGGPGAFTGVDRWLSRTATGDVVFAPPLRRKSGRAAALSPAVTAQLWSRARLGRRWLFAPVLERPMRDMIALMGSGSAA